MWTELKDQNGRFYYYDNVTQKTSWEKPVELYDELDNLLESSHWKKYYSAEQKKYYYYNTETKQTTWNVPVEVPKKRAREEDVQVVNKKPKVSGVKYQEKYQIDSESKPQEISQEDQKEKFIELLKENAIDTSWSFQKVMETFIGDPRYFVLDDTLSKKEYFEAYLIDKSKKELLEASNSKERFQKEFKSLITKYASKVRYYTRWKTFAKLISDEPIYDHSILSEREKKEIFNEHVNKLRQDHVSKENELKSQAVSELHEYFLGTLKKQLTFENSWQDILDIIKTDTRIKQNKNFKRLNKLDILNLYSKFYEEQESDLNQQIKSLDKVNYTQDRYARDLFKQLMQEITEVNVDTDFDEIFLQIKEDERFLNMLGRAGSSPLQLFYDIIEDLRIVLQAQKDIIFNFLVEKKFEVLLKSEQEFIDFINSNKQAFQLDENSRDILARHLKYIYNLLVKQSLNDLVKKKKSTELVYEDHKHNFKKEVMQKITLKHLNQNGINNMQVLNQLTWQGLKPDIEKESLYKNLLDFMQLNYRFLFDLQFTKKTEFEYFINNSKGVREIIEATQENKVDEKLIERLVDQLILKLKDEIIEAEKNVGAEKQGSIMELDY